MHIVPSDQTRARMRVKDKTCVSTIWVRLMTIALSGCATAALTWSAIQHRKLDVDTEYANFYFWALGPLVFSVCWCAINVLFALVVRRPLHPAIALCSDFIAFGAILTFGILIHFKINARGPGSKCTVDDCAAKLHKLYIVERSGEVISLVAAGFEFLIFILAAIGCFTHRFEGGSSDRRVQWKGASRGPTGRQFSATSGSVRSGPGRLSQASTIQNDKAMVEKKNGLEANQVDIAAGFERDDPWMASYGSDPNVLDYEKYDNIDLEDHEVDEKALKDGKHSSPSKIGKPKPSPIFISPTRASNKVATRGTSLDPKSQV